MLADWLPLLSFGLVFSGVMAWLWDRRPQQEFASADLVAGESLSLSIEPPSDLKSVSLWIEVDLEYPRGERIGGPITVTAAGRTILRSTLALGHGRRIVEGPPSGFRHRFSSFQVGPAWRVRGHSRLTRLTGAALRGPIVVEAAPSAGPSVTIKTARVYACR